MYNTVLPINKNLESKINFELLVVRPAPGVVFGLQKGSGKTYETVQRQTATTGDLTFKFSTGIKCGPTKDAMPNLSGSFVQGPANSRFIYIDIGTYAGQHDSIWSRRLKVPLTGIDWKLINELSESSVLWTSVPGIGKDGGPNCATVKPFAGWKIKRINF